jgi:hemerythrin-like domain-containing protein
MEATVPGKRIIEQEHRSLAAVLHALLYSVREIRYLHSEPDFVLLTAMLDYVDSFLERLHHPKEDLYLFERLRVRCPGAIPLLDRLRAEHVSGTARLQELRDALDSYRLDVGSGFVRFGRLAADYAAFHWSHMSAEENELLPLAAHHLTAGDWIIINEAFAGNSDPLFGPLRTQEFQLLFKSIVDMAPPPMGSGRRRTKDTAA